MTRREKRRSKSGHSRARARARERDQEKEESKRDEKEFLSPPCLRVSPRLWTKKRERERKIPFSLSQSPQTEVVCECRWPGTQPGRRGEDEGGRASGTVERRGGDEGARGQK